MSSDLLTRAVAAFAAVTLASLLTTSAAIAATGNGLGRGKIVACAIGQCPPAPLQIKSASVTKAKAVIAFRAGR